MNWLIVFGFICIFQGIYLLLVSWTLKFSKSSILALNILILSQLILVFSAVYNEMEWYLFSPHFININLPIPLLIGPSIYVLFLTVFEFEKPLSKFTWIHYSPFLFYAVILTPYYVLPYSTKVAGVNLSQLLGFEIAIIEHSKIAITLLYILTVLSMFLIKKPWRNSKLKLKRFAILFLILIISQVLMILTSIIHFALYMANLDSLYTIELTLCILFTVIIYTTTYLFMTYNDEWYKHFKKTKSPILSQSESHMKRLTFLMNEQKLYTNNALKIEDVAIEVGITKRELSQMIQHKKGLNYASYINEYRVMEFKRKVANPSENSKTLLGIAYESGFNSKSSFQRIFKEITGLTPKAFKNSLKNKSH